jgi:adenine/guanine phosphoribosyltransferase-like PRPP-binding protein
VTKNRSFWDGMAVGAAAGLMLGMAMVVRRRHEPTPMERTKMVVGRTTRQAIRRARGAWSNMAGRFSD